ncbi:MAG: glycosyltransferase family 2 protein [Chloroflexi bacterium]|nr:glycosyltransferase family 2 protein [Chloroflexota bacterium]
MTASAAASHGTTRISVVVPTYRRASHLKQCLSSLVDQSRKPDEIVIVAREDDGETLEAAKDFQKEHGAKIAIKAVSVERPGMTAARNRGLQEVADGIVCFIDDDAAAAPGWLEGMERWFDNPKIGAVGGPCIDVRVPEDDLRTFPSVFKISRLGAVSRLGADCLTPGPVSVDHLRGANLCLRRSLVPGFDENLVGHSFREDMDVCLSVKSNGFDIMYDPALKVDHFIAPTVDTGRGEAGRLFWEANANNTYVLLKHLKGWRRLVFLVFTFAIGDNCTPGLARCLARAVLYRSPEYLTDKLAPSLKGKWDGMRLYFERRGRGWGSGR